LLSRVTCSQTSPAPKTMNGAERSTLLPIPGRKCLPEPDQLRWARTLIHYFLFSRNLLRVNSPTQDSDMPFLRPI
jgi:hypothetical protein